MLPIGLLTAIVFCATFGGVLAGVVVHDRQRRRTTAGPVPDWRAALGNALVETVVMVGALVVAFVAVIMRGS
jgi:hypothetical protein